MFDSRFSRHPRLAISNPVYIGDLKKAEVLAALYTNAALVRGLLLWHILYDYIPEAEAIERLERRPTFYWLHGRHLHVDLSGDHFDPNEYDRMVGVRGTAQRVVNHLRVTGTVYEPLPGLAP